MWKLGLDCLILFHVKTTETIRMVLKMAKDVKPELFNQ